MPTFLPNPGSAATLYSEGAGGLYSSAMPVVLAAFCPGCGNEITTEAHYCHLCGVTLGGGESAHRFGAFVRDSVEYGAIWRRFLASAIDAVLVMSVVATVAIAFTWTMEVVSPALGLDREDSRFLCGMVAVVLWMVADWLYNARMQSSSLQATIGKRFMRLKVTDLSGERISFAQATARHFAKFLSTFAAFVGFFITILSKRSQALHDMVAGTLVVRR
ncbi:MAG TPA: RDD family protein [Clostridia bacterium]|nr:RDD family protein [Clostridia bacterium]